MSMILDALRKIEQERRTRRQGSTDIRADVLNYHGRTLPPRKSPMIILVGFALIAVIATALVFLARQGSPTGAAEATAPATATQPAPQPVMAPSPHPPAVQAEPTAKPATVPAAVAPKPAVHVPDSGEPMVISGIAWQEERSLRRAVINGILTGEGAEILGARILEIREDRVIFSRNGKSFEANYAGGAGR